MAIIPYPNNSNSPDASNDIGRYQPGDRYHHTIDNRPIDKIHNNVKVIDAALEGVGILRNDGVNSGSETPSHYRFRGFKIGDGNGTMWTIVPNFDSMSPSFNVWFSDKDLSSTLTNPDAVWDLAGTSTDEVIF